MALRSLFDHLFEVVDGRGEHLTLTMPTLVEDTLDLPRRGSGGFFSFGIIFSPPTTILT